MEAKIKIEGHGGQLLYSLRRNAKILWCPTNLIVEWFVVGKRAGTRKNARARARERRKLAASKRGKWGGIRTEHKAAKRATRSRVALAVSCGGVFDVDGGNEMSLARGGEHHTARASRVIIVVLSIEVIARGAGNTAAVWDGEAEDEAKQKQRKESGVLCWSCEGISEDASRALYRI